MTSNTATDTNADIVHQLNGNYGHWQLRSILLIFLCKIPTAWFTACIVYTAPTPQQGELVCRPAAAVTSSIMDDITHSIAHTMQWAPVAEQRTTDRVFDVDVCKAYAKHLEQNLAGNYNEYVPMTNMTLTAAQQMEVNGQTDEQTDVDETMIPCAHIEHNAAFKSLVVQFDLICSRRALVAVTQSFHGLGALVGGLLAYSALNHISPRRLMLLGMLGQIFCGNLTGLVATYQLHIYFRCLTSAFCALMWSAGQVILTDITAGKAGTIVITLSDLFWSIGLILLPAISAYFDSWSYLYMAISNSLVVLVFLHRWIAESPRWLLRHNKVEHALRVMLESATYNNRAVPLTLELQLNIYAKQLRAESRIGYWQIWNGNTPHKDIAFIHLCWGCAMMLYNIILLMIRSLGTDQMHVNTACLGFAEMLGLFLGLYIILYTRRYWRWTGILMIFAGLCTYFIWLLPELTRAPRRVRLELIFWVLLKFANAASIAVLTTRTRDMVSAEKRALLMLSVITFSRFCLTFVPLLTTLTVVHRLLPISITATLGWLYGILLCHLNRFYWNTRHPYIRTVPTPNTYRRNSAILLQRRSSCCYENSLTVSISDLWHTSCDTVNEAEVVDVEMFDMRRVDKESQRA